MDSDVSFNSKIIYTFISVAKEIKDFVILAPQHEKITIKMNFFQLNRTSLKIIT